MSIILTDEMKVSIKIAYLNILQNNITRMATFSVGMKTASITVLLAVLAYSPVVPIDKGYKLLIYFIPWGFFAGYHAYFLKLERAFRTLYNQTARQTDISFQDLSIDKSKLITASKGWLDVIKSLPYYIFHFILLLIAIIAITR